jgi:phage/plasmid-associated DNA primase
MYDETEKKIIDFKTSTSQQIQIEWILQLLSYASLIRIHKKLPVEYISIYNPVSGIESIIDIKNWNKEKELLDYIKQIRDDREKIKKASLNEPVKFEVPKKKYKDTIKPINKKEYKETRDILLNDLDEFSGMDEETMKEYIKLTKK